VLIGGLVFVVAGLPLLNQSFERKDQAMFHAVMDLLRPAPAVTAAAREGVAAPKMEQAEQGRQALLCSSCLAHAVNEGYQFCVGDRLHKLNGQVVKNMAHVVALLAPLLDPTVEPERSHVVLQFYRPRAAVVFETAALRVATPVIQDQHKVPSWTNVLPKTEASAEDGASPATVQYVRL